MASMRELFPSYNPTKKPQRNFIKENIRNAKGCKECIANKRQLDTKNIVKHEDSQKTKTIKFKSEADLRVAAMKIANRANFCTSSRNGNVQRISNDQTNEKSNVTDNTKNLQNSIKPTSTGIKCQNCGHLVSSDCVMSELKEKGSSTTALNDDVISAQCKDYHRLSHENEDNYKKTTPSKSVDLSLYKKGQVPRYLKERNARLIQEEQEKKEREKLVEKLGLNDPRCPPGHMLMPPEQLQENYQSFQSQYQSLIQELNKMPVSSDSFRILKRKIEIEKELRELDDKISLYRSGKVFITISNSAAE